MNCSNCGKSVDGSARFCSACGAAVAPAAYQYGPRASRFVRPREGRMVAGVCAGLAMAWGIDVVLLRWIVALLVVMGMGSPLIGYVIAWVVMPNADYAIVVPPVAPGTGVYGA